MSFFNTVTFILRHPLARRHKSRALIRYAKWQAYFRINPHPIFYPYVERTRLLTYRGLTGALFSMYTGLHEFEDMALVMHLLRPEDTFVDIGANIGSYSVLSAGVVGCSTLAVEPVPSTFQLLRQNVVLNRLDERVTLHNVGLGSETGTLKFTESLDTVNHVATDPHKPGIEVPIKRLDDLVQEIPIAVKIDVEGFEWEVLVGSKKVLNAPGLKVIIIELNGSGRRYGYADEDIHALLTDLGFQPFAYQPFTRTLVRRESFGTHNTIYLRDVTAVRERIASARKVRVLGEYL